MSKEKITYRECLQIYQVEESFLDALQSSGLIEIVVEEEDRYIEYDYLQEIEQFVRWYYELEINIEGIETALKFDSRVLIEDYILSQELSVAVLQTKDQTLVSRPVM